MGAGRLLCWKCLKAAVLQAKLESWRGCFAGTQEGRRPLTSRLENWANESSPWGALGAELGMSGTWSWVVGVGGGVV